MSNVMNDSNPTSNQSIEMSNALYFFHFCIEHRPPETIPGRFAWQASHR